MGIPQVAQDNIDFVLDKWGVEPAKPPGPTVLPNAGRLHLAKLFHLLDFRSIVEVGVERGRYSEVLARENPRAAVYGVDPWRAYGGYREHVTQEKLDGFYEATKERMAPYPLYRPVRKFSMEALDDFEDGELDAVYVDGNHTLPHVINDIIEWSRKVRIGGIVSGHDYRKSKRINTRNHVVYAVHCYVESYRMHPWFLLGRKMAEPNEVRDNTRSWFWVRMR